MNWYAQPARCSLASSDSKTGRLKCARASKGSASFEFSRRTLLPPRGLRQPSAGAIERFAQAMRAPLPRGRAGGLARARSAWRYFDGTFMPESEKEAAYLEEYERYAAGGRTRAALGVRDARGRFC